jgi:hypothetical protein
MADAHTPAGDAADLARRDRLLRVGRGLHADVRLHETASGPCIVKDYSRRPAWLRRTWGRWICAHEQSVYREMEARLGPADWRPRLIGPSGAHAFALGYRPGRPLSRALADELPRDFVERLEQAVQALHAAGIVHLDLSHRSNVLVDEQGRPVLLDFASAMTAPRGGLRHRLLVSVLGRLDRRALRKWRRKLGREGRAHTASPPRRA